jgi:2,4-dienoyl-CoA reductase-like NADH-dependent reductase (Old Yellow Enzyme family)
MKGYIETRSKGGAGLLIVEYTAVKPGGRTAAKELGIK